MDWLDQYLHELHRPGAVMHFPPDQQSWHAPVPSKQQLSLIQDATVADMMRMRMIQEARQMEMDAGMGGGYDAGSAARERPAAPSPLLNGLLAYWKLDQTLSDATVNGNNLSIELGADNYVPAIINDGFSFDGQTSLTPSSGPGALAFGTGDFSVSFWVYPTSAPNNNNVIIGWGIWPNTSGFVVQYTTGNFGFYLGGFAEFFGYSPPTMFNVWHHIVVVRTSGTANFYVNGINRGSANWNYDFTDGLWHIGRAQDVADYFLNGTLDEMGAWNRALSGAEIISLYNAGAGKTYPFN